MEIVDLHSIVPNLSIDYGHYRRSEDEVINPALIAAGYSGIGLWYSTEHDSWGPLGREVIVENPDGEKVIVSYG